MKRNPAEVPYQLLGLAGALLWAGVMLARESGTALPGAVLPLLRDVGPNAGVVWLGMSLFVTVYPMLLGRPARKLDRTLAVFAMLALLLLSEIVHDRFLHSPFDWADIAASAIAALPVLALIAFRPEAEKAATESGMSARTDQ